MPAPNTFEEPKAQPPPLRALLFYVACYDDLLADESLLCPLPPGPLCIGRGEEGIEQAGGELRLPDSFLSGRHALLEPHGDRHVLSDEGSRNGTFVLGTKITRHLLGDGDLIEVGHSLLCYRLVPAPLLPLLQDGAARMGPTRTLCPEVAALQRDLSRIAPSDEPVLLLGETGTGKEVAARMIHDRSGRKGPLVSLDCGAIPEALFESTLFGHRRGAFTGADKERVGEMVRADGGTLFLDELGNLPPASQARLLRALETRLVVPLGGSTGQEVDVRFVAATNRDVHAEDGGFRQDLLRRLSGYVAHLPPLRRRREDLGTLAAWLLREAGVKAAALSPQAGRRLFHSDFPGNIRELRTVLRSASLLAAGGPIQPGHLMLKDAPPRAEAAPRGARTAEEVAAALRKTQGNVVQAAKLLGTQPKQIYRYLERYGLDLEAFRRQ
jgi:sigma-54 dependent transcriptional regulator, acetoin dehydrogenase operon transcriptional activator AcoR